MHTLCEEHDREGHDFSRAEEKNCRQGLWALHRNGVNKLQFQIKGKDYFLAFVEDERRWYVFAPTAQGVHRIAVYVDAVKYEKTGILETETHLSS